MIVDPEPFDLPDLSDATQADLVARVMRGELVYTLGGSGVMKLRNATPEHQARWLEYLDAVGVQPTLTGAAWSGVIALAGAFDG